MRCGRSRSPRRPPRPPARLAPALSASCAALDARRPGRRLAALLRGFLQGTEKPLFSRGDPLNLIRVMPAKGESGRGPTSARPFFHRRRRALTWSGAAMRLTVNGEARAFAASATSRRWWRRSASTGARWRWNAIWRSCRARPMATTALRRRPDRDRAFHRRRLTWTDRPRPPTKTPGPSPAAPSARG